jgi:hypothetical protein
MVFALAISFLCSLFFISIFACCPLLAPAMSASSVAFAIHYDSPPLFFISIFACCPLLAPAMSASSVAFAIHYDSPLFMFQDTYGVRCRSKLP